MNRDEIIVLHACGRLGSTPNGFTLDGAAVTDDEDAQLIARTLGVPRPVAAAAPDPEPLAPEREPMSGGRTRRSDR